MDERCTSSPLRTTSCAVRSAAVEVLEGGINATAGMQANALLPAPPPESLAIFARVVRTHRRKGHLHSGHEAQPKSGAPGNGVTPVKPNSRCRRPLAHQTIVSCVDRARSLPLLSTTRTTHEFWGQCAYRGTIAQVQHVTSRGHQKLGCHRWAKMNPCPNARQTPIVHHPRQTALLTKSTPQRLRSDRSSWQQSLRRDQVRLSQPSAKSAQKNYGAGIAAAPSPPANDPRTLQRTETGESRRRLGGSFHRRF